MKAMCDAPSLRALRTAHDPATRGEGRQLCDISMGLKLALGGSRNAAAGGASTAGQPVGLLLILTKAS